MIGAKMIKQVTYPNIQQLILFGGGSTLMNVAEYFLEQGCKVSVFTATRHAEELVRGRNGTLSVELKLLGIPLVITDDINQCPELFDEINEHTMGIGFGEAWSFSNDIIEAFDRIRLLDFMGIPLPRYRGGAHYTWMIQREERRGGFHLQLINEEMVQGEYDSGELIYSEPFIFPKDVKIPEDYFESAQHAELAFMKRFHKKIQDQVTFECQLPEASESLYFPRLNAKIHAWIDWHWNSQSIVQFIDSFDHPYNGAQSFWNNQIILLQDVALDHSEGRFHPYQSGLVTRILLNENGIDVNSISVITVDGLLIINKIKNEEGVDLSREIKVGDRFYTPMEKIMDAKTKRISYGADSCQPNIKHHERSSSALDSPFDNLKLSGKKINLRPISMDDCSQRYLAWLQDAAVNQYLETRWMEQSIDSIRGFVSNIRESDNQFLFAIIDNISGSHLGNIKIGPINDLHKNTEISYFIGDQSFWGKGIATEAIQLISNFSLQKGDIDYILAGVYESNIASIKALEKSGYTLQGRLIKQLVGPNGREDHLFYGLNADR